MSDNGLGFDTIEALNTDIDGIVRGLNDAAASRGIVLNGPSDALDMSHDLIVDEAIQPLRCNWDIVDRTLRVWPNGWPTWPVAGASAEPEGEHQ